MSFDWTQDFTGTDGDTLASLPPATVGSGTWVEKGSSIVDNSDITSGVFLIANPGGGGVVGLRPANRYQACYFSQPMSTFNQRVVASVHLFDNVASTFGAAFRATSADNYVGLEYRPSTGTWRAMYGRGYPLSAEIPDLVGPLATGQTHIIEYRIAGPDGDCYLQAYIGGVLRFSYHVTLAVGVNSIGHSGLTADGPTFTGTTGYLWVSAAAGPDLLVPTGSSVSGPTVFAPGVPSVNIDQYHGGGQCLSVTLTPVGAAAPQAVTFTPSDGGAGGTFAPPTLTVAQNGSVGYFTYRPPTNASDGQTITLSFTNDGGLTNPTAFPITVTNRLLIVAGNSISAVINGDAASWPQLLRLAGGATVPAIVNVSQSGIETPSLDALFSNTYDTALVTNMGPDVRPVIVLFEGGNDLAHNAGYSGSTLAAHYETFVSNRRAAWPARTKIVAATWPQWTSWTTDEKARSSAAAVLIRASNSWDALVDLEADPLPPSAGYTNDGVHPTVLGAQHYRDVFGPVVEANTGAALSLSGPTGPLADGDTDAVPGTVAHNSVRTYTVTNNGTVDAPDVAVTVPANTTLVGGQPGTIPPGESRTVKVRFPTPGVTVDGDLVVSGDGVASITVGVTATVGEASVRGRGTSRISLGL